jgi:hypothetical protein
MEDHEQQSVARSETKDGENVIWWGQPSGKEMAKSGRSVFIIGIGLLFMSLCYIGIPYLLYEDSDQDFMKYIFLFISLPFLVISLRMIAAPTIEKRKANRTVYAVTNQRAMIIATGKNKKVTSYFPGDIIAINRKINEDGSGNLLFTMNPSRAATNPGSGIKNAFLGVPDVQVVEMYLRDFLQISKSIS